MKARGIKKTGTGYRSQVTGYRCRVSGAGRLVKHTGDGVLATFSDREPCRGKTRRPPSDAALAEAERIRRSRAGGADGEHVVLDFADYAGQARPLRGDASGHAGDEAGQQ